VNSDEHLLEQIKAGDRSAFEAFYHRHQQSVYRLSVYLCRDPHVAEELFQDVWFRVTRHLRRGKPVRKPRQWLMTLTANVCRDAWRRNRLRRTLFAHPSDVVSSDTATTPPPDAAWDFNQALQRGLDVLSERQRTAFVLSIIEGFKLAEIAEIMSVAEGTVKATLHAAVKKMRHQLEEFHETDL
jgi:RNA polymerase sigma-70 factor (ECF subfamily)